MKFKMTMFWVNKGGVVEPLLEGPFLDLASLELAREAALRLAMHENVPAHSVAIESEDGSVSERWFQLDGEWRLKHA